MKVAFYINTIAYGGAERVITNLASEMAARGHVCILVTTNNVDEEYKLHPNIKRYVLFDRKPTSFIERNVKSIKNLNKILTDEVPDIMVTFMAEANFRGILAALGTKVKTLISVRNDPSREYKGFILSFLAKSLFRLADYVVFQTGTARDWFPSAIRHKSDIIYNPTNKVFYDTKLKDNRKGIVSVGRIVEQKNHPMLLKAYALIAEQVEDDLYIYGEGGVDYLLELASELGIAERVHFPGKSSNIPEVLSSSRLFVMTSDYEGMPNALMEAMAIGLPCISTDCPCGGPNALFPDIIHEYLVPVGDYELLSVKILQVLKNKDLERMLASECKKAALAFESSIIFDKWENCLMHVIKEK